MLTKRDYWLSRRVHVAPLDEFPFRETEYGWAMANAAAGYSASREAWPPGTQVVANAEGKMLIRDPTGKGKAYYPVPNDIFSSDWSAN